MRWSRTWSARAAVALALGAFALPTAAGAVEARAVVATTTPLAASDVVVHTPHTATFDVALDSAHPRALATFLGEIENRASPLYRGYVTPSQYARRFGASTSTIASLRTYFDGFGLRVTGVDAGRNLIRVRGPTPSIARALDATVDTVRLASGALVAHLETEATLPDDLASAVAGVAGLTDVTGESANAKVAAASAPTTCPSAGSSSGTTPNLLGGYTATQQAALYGLSQEWASGDVAQGETVGVYELASFNTKDVSSFLACYGVGDNVTTVNVDGGPTTGDDACTNESCGPEEATLDVEEAQVLAPGAKVVVYQGTNDGNGPTDVYAAIASADKADVVTTSWGLCELDPASGYDTEAPLFEQMTAQGQSIVAAAGDSGSSDCDQDLNEKSAAVDDPASQPYVTGVGGLSVSDTDPLAETVWNEGCSRGGCGASGGGESAVWSRPSWQVAPGIASTATMRMVPDLSVMGDPRTGFIEYFTGNNAGQCYQGCAGWSSIGGTSIGAPLVSDLIATGAEACGTTRLGLVNPSLYQMASTGFTDVTTGSNDVYDIGVYSAGPGYDMASGLGSPDGAAFFSGLCAAPYSTGQSSFSVSASSAPANSVGPTVTGTLRDDDGNPIADTPLEVTATAKGGELHINGDRSSLEGLGEAREAVVTDANGDLSFTVSSTLAQSVTVAVTDAGVTLYSTVIDFTAESSYSPPGPPSIARLRALVGGFALTVRPPKKDGGRPITRYQYTLNSGRTWRSMKRGATRVRVVGLERHATYVVRVRATNAVGASAPSPSRRVVTGG